MKTIKTILVTLFIVMTISPIFGQTNVTLYKGNIARNWMIKIIKTSTDTEEPNKSNPKTDLTIEANGNFSWYYKSTYSGTWRMDGAYLFLFYKNENAKHPYNSITQCFKIIELKDNLLSIIALTPTQTTDISIEFVPFN
jgi:hypothetical protein